MILHAKKRICIVYYMNDLTLFNDRRIYIYISLCFGSALATTKVTQVCDIAFI